MLRVAEHFERTDTGRQRRANEDAFHARSPLFAVADGMGGAQAGEVASHIAVEVLQDGLPEGEGSIEQRLAGLVSDANARIHELSRTDEARAGMGTTMTAAYVGEDDLTVAHVGDSRIYLLRDGELERLSRDHSLVEELVREGKLTPQEAEEHPQRSIITRALGPEPGVQVDTATHRVRDGDVVLICSDGLTSMISEDKVRDILAGAPSLREAGLGLVDAANAAGGRDNITVVLLRLEEVDRHTGGTDDQATMVGVAAPKTAEVRAAVAERQETDTAARRRMPTPPRPPTAAEKRRRAPRTRSTLKSLAIVALVVTPILLAAYFATQTVYFVGTGNDGFVTLYRGVPYDLPAGVNLYTKNFESGVAVDTLPVRVRKTVSDHKLRSRDDAIDLVRQIERGELTGQ
jgi:protein phosphatase